MKSISLSEFKNSFGVFVDQVKRGKEAILITERKIPILKLIAVSQDPVHKDSGLIDRLERAGHVVRAQCAVPLREIRPVKPAQKGKLDILQALLEERKEGR